MSRWHETLAAISIPIHTFPETVTRRQQARAIKVFTPLQRITTTIKRVWLAKIVDGSKKIEYREIKPYWTAKLKGISVPFELRLINGMSKTAPEVTVLIKKVDVGFQGSNEGDEEGKVYRLHIGRILNIKNWPVKSGE